MAAENEVSYTPKHARGPIEPIADEPIEVEPVAAASPEEELPEDGPVDAEVPADSPAAPADAAEMEQEGDFDTDQMRSLSFLYGEGQRDARTQPSQRASGGRRPRGNGPRHVGRTQHPADFTASKYLGDGALKSSAQRKSSDYKTPGSQQRKSGARHSAQAARGASQRPDDPEAARGRQVRAEAAPPGDKDRTQVIEEARPARGRRTQQGSTRVLPSERARRAAAADETMVVPAAHAAAADATRVAPASRGGVPVAGVAHDEGGGRRAGKRRGRKVVLIVIVLIIALVAVCAALLFRSAQQVQTDALELNKAVATLSDDFRMGDFDKVSESVAEIDEISDRMLAETSSPLWKAASVLPVVGDDANNAIVLCETIDQLGDEVLVPLFQDFPDVDSMSKEEQAEFASDLVAYKDKVVAAKEVIAGLDEGRIDQLNTAIAKAEDVLGKAEVLLGG